MSYPNSKNLITPQPVTSPTSYPAELNKVSTGSLPWGSAAVDSILSVYNPASDCIIFTYTKPIDGNTYAAAYGPLKTDTPFWGSETEIIPNGLYENISWLGTSSGSNIYAASVAEETLYRLTVNPTTMAVTKAGSDTLTSGDPVLGLLNASGVQYLLQRATTNVRVYSLVGSNLTSLYTTSSLDNSTVTYLSCNGKDIQINTAGIDYITGLSSSGTLSITSDGPNPPNYIAVKSELKDQIGLVSGKGIQRYTVTEPAALDYQLITDNAYNFEGIAYNEYLDRYLGNTYDSSSLRKWELCIYKNNTGAIALEDRITDDGVDTLYNQRTNWILTSGGKYAIYHPPAAPNGTDYPLEIYKLI